MPEDAVVISDETKALLLLVAKAYLGRWIEDYPECADDWAEEATKELYQHLEVAYGTGYLDAITNGENG